MKRVSDLNDPEKVNDLLNVLFSATGKKSKLKVSIPRDSILRLSLDEVDYDFNIDFELQTNLWFVDS